MGPLRAGPCPSHSIWPCTTGIDSLEGHSLGLLEPFGAVLRERTGPDRRAQPKRTA